MIALLAATLLLQQGRAPEVMLAVDRDRVAPGEIVTFSIRVTSEVPDPIRVDLPALGGFEVESRSERSDVSTGPSPGRTTWIELKLRATTPGEWRLGPVNVRQGIAFAQSDAVDVTIAGGAPAPVMGSISTRLARLIQRAPPPDVLAAAGITVALSDASVVVGEQVDVVTIAWFERETRQRLRRAPTVESPQIEGVWTYPQAVPGGIAASRQVNGRWYDLFVLHQVAFPLTPGRFAVSAAKLTYNLPLAYQFFSQEERFTLQSEATSFAARALPDAGRRPDFAGAVGHGLTITRRLTPPAGRQGEAFNAEVEIRGEGNVALWPEPATRWPAGVRVYPEASEERPGLTDGRFGGSKVFRYLVIPDSAGTLSLSPLEYAYFDPVEGRYDRVPIPSLSAVVAPRGERVVARAEPPPIRLDLRVPVALRALRALPGPAWWLLALAPVAAWLLPRVPRRRPRVARASLPSATLAEAERRLGRALRRFGERGEDAGPLQELKAQVEAARFAPGGAGPERALLARVEAALAAAGEGGGRGGPRWRRRAGFGLLLALVGAQAMPAQSGPEQLYEAGAYRAAAAGFLRRALLAPEVTTHWFNLGDAAFRAGDDAAALAAWVRAGRLSPRDGGVRRALLLVPPADSRAAEALWLAPVTPEELALLALVLWFAGWGGVLWTREWKGRWLVLLGAAAVLAGAGALLQRHYANPIAIAAANQQLRLSPHELAPAVGEVTALGTVALEERRGDWVRVVVSGGPRGWLEVRSLVPVAGPQVP